MIVHVRSKLLTTAALLAATALAACGGGSSSGKNGGSGLSAAENTKQVNKIIKEAFGVNDKADSGKLDATVDVDVKGVPRFKDPVQITLDGGFELPSGASAPDFDLDAGIVLRDQAYGASLVYVGGKAYIELGTTGYRLPDHIATSIGKPAAARNNGLVKLAGMFYINPQNWRKNTKIVGDQTIAGVPTTHLTAGIRGDRFFRDISKLIDLLTSLRVTEVAGLPTKLPPAQQAALVRSITFAKGDVYVGKTDHVVRKAHLEGTIVVSAKDRKLLGGVKSGKVVADLNISEVGQPQNLKAPSELGSYSDLQLTLDALAESIKKARGTG
jgi:hypothetical protein